MAPIAIIQCYNYPFYNADLYSAPKPMDPNISVITGVHCSIQNVICAFICLPGTAHPYNQCVVQWLWNTWAPGVGMHRECQLSLADNTGWYQFCSQMSMEVHIVEAEIQTGTCDHHVVESVSHLHRFYLKNKRSIRINHSSELFLITKKYI